MKQFTLMAAFAITGILFSGALSPLAIAGTELQMKIHPESASAIQLSGYALAFGIPLLLLLLAFITAPPFGASKERFETEQ